MTTKFPRLTDDAGVRAEQQKLARLQGELSTAEIAYDAERLKSSHKSDPITSAAEALVAGESFSVATAQAKENIGSALYSKILVLRRAIEIQQGKVNVAESAAAENLAKSFQPECRAQYTRLAAAMREATAAAREYYALVDDLQTAGASIGVATRDCDPLPAIIGDWLTSRDSGFDCEHWLSATK